MYFNDTLNLLTVSEKDAGMGYTKKCFRKYGEPFAVDRQPYSPEMARKEYGLDDSGARLRCYTKRKGLTDGDYVRLGNGDKFVILLVTEWERHTELILGVFKE
jgi:hypothetical protein